MPLDAVIGDDWHRAGIKVLLRFRPVDGYEETLWAPGGSERYTVRGDTSTDPNLTPLTLSHDEGRALLDGLTRYYGGSEDNRALRKDYDAERARVDKMLDYLIASPPPELIQAVSRGA